jgi:hypothetical protein
MDTQKDDRDQKTSTWLLFELLQLLLLMGKKKEAN